MCERGVIGTTSGGIKSLDFFLLKFYSCSEYYYLTILVFLSCGPVWASMHYSSVIKTSFSVLLPPSAFISQPEGSLKFTGFPMAPHLIFFFLLWLLTANRSFQETNFSATLQKFFTIH